MVLSFRHVSRTRTSNCDGMVTLGSGLTREVSRMPKKNEEATLLSTLQDLLIFQMASGGVPQTEIRKAVGVDMNRVNKIARLAKKAEKMQSDQR